MGLHPRGNFEGWLRAGSRQKWLEVHGDTHFTHFYSSYGETLQKRFFGHFLKGENTGWEQQPRGLAQHPPSRRDDSRCAPRTNGRSRERDGRNISCSRTGPDWAPSRPCARRR